MKIVCISDTHNQHDRLTVPDGDVLVHAGDFSMVGERGDVLEFNRWLGTLPHKHKVIVAGNHDFILERQWDAYKLFTNATYLQDSGVEIDGVRFWGSPITPYPHTGWAFTRKPGDEIRPHWSRIPDDTDVLITHGPPFKVLDYCVRDVHAGCRLLRATVMQRVRPKFHVFGHIHEGYGKVEFGGVTYVNACSLDVRYRVANDAIVVQI